MTKTDYGGPPTGPREAAYFRGVASVPVPAPLRDDTGEYLPAGPGEVPRMPGAPRGMVVRRRGRQLRRGAGWTWTGVSFVTVCWGIWAVSLRGSDLFGPLLGLMLVLVTGALVFTVSRLLGRTVLEGALGRERRSAWPSHLVTCVFLLMAGIAFLQQTRWIVNGWNWLVGHLLP